MDIGGESTRPGAEPVPVDEELRRIVPVLEGLIGLAVRSTRRSGCAAGARSRRRARERRQRATRRPRARRRRGGRGRLRVPDAHAGQPRRCSSTPLRRRRRRRTAFLEERLAFAVAEGIPRTASASIPASGSARRQTRTCSSCRGLARSWRSGARCSWASPGSRRSVVRSADARVGSVDGSVGAAVAAFDRGASIFRVHDVRPHVEALALAAAVEREESNDRRGARHRARRLSRRWRRNAGAGSGFWSTSGSSRPTRGPP